MWPVLSILRTHTHSERVSAKSNKDDVGGSCHVIAVSNCKRMQFSYEKKKNPLEESEEVGMCYTVVTLERESRAAQR